MNTINTSAPSGSPYSSDYKVQPDTDGPSKQINETIKGEETAPDLLKVMSAGAEQRYLAATPPLHDKSSVKEAAQRQTGAGMDGTGGRKSATSRRGSDMSVDSKNGSATVNGFNAPGADIAARVASIMRNCAVQTSHAHEGLVGDWVSPRVFYPTFGVSVAAGAGLSHIDAGSQSAVLGLLPFVAGQGRIMDGFLTWDGYRAASEKCQREWTASCNHLNTLLGIKALNDLEEEYSRLGGAQTAENKELIRVRRQELEKQAVATTKAFQAFFPNDSVATRNLVGTIRDMNGATTGTANSLLSLSANSAKASEHGVLSAGVKTLGTVASGVSAGLGVVSGGLSVLQGSMELSEGCRDKDALEAAERFDKEVYAQYGGADFPELEHLITHRNRLRELERLKATLLQANAILRLAYGGVGLSSAGVSIALLAGATLSAGATMGTTVVMGAVAAGLFMLWINVRATMALKAQKEYTKAEQAINKAAMNEIVEGLKNKLENEKTRERATKTLLALGMPAGAIDAATRGNCDWLKECLLPERGMPVTEADALRNFYASPKATAGDKLDAVLAWQANPNLGDEQQLSAKRAAPPDSWSRYLACGKDMTNVCKSTLTQVLVEKHWNDDKLQALMKRSLRGAEGVPFKDHKEAWRALEDKRKEQALSEKAPAIVAGWIADASVNDIRRCLALGKRDALTLACKKVLASTYGITSVRGMPAALCSWALRQPLNEDNIALFLTACKLSPTNGVKMAFVEKIQAFMTASQASLPAEERAAFMQALLQGKATSLHTGNVDAALGRLEKFLIVSKKLRGQTLTKVVASLHEYPTDSSIPKALSRAAAMRELALRLPESADPDFVQHAFGMARQLAGQKLHRRTWGAGEGGGFLGFGGYELNEKGKLLRQVFETCMAPGQVKKPQGLTEGSTADTSSLKDLTKQDRHMKKAGAAGGGGQTAARYCMQRLSDSDAVPDDYSVAQLVKESAMYRDRGALVKALKTGKGIAFDAAVRCLTAQMQRAARGMKKAADELNGADFVARLQDFLALETLAKKYHTMKGMPQAQLDESRGGLAVIGERLGFYRAALQWSNKTARNKNIKAIQKEFQLLKTGQLDPLKHANPLWSAKFLKAQGKAAAFSDTLRTHHDWLPAGTPYKKAVKSIEALNGMWSTDVLKAIKQKGEKGIRWVRHQFKSKGRVMQEEQAVMERLRKAQTKHELLRLMAKELSSAPPAVTSNGEVSALVSEPVAA